MIVKKDQTGRSGEGEIDTDVSDLQTLFKKQGLFWIFCHIFRLRYKDDKNV